VSTGNCQAELVEDYLKTLATLVTLRQAQCDNT